MELGYPAEGAGGWPCRWPWQPHRPSSLPPAINPHCTASPVFWTRLTHFRFSFRFSRSALHLCINLLQHQATVYVFPQWPSSSNLRVSYTMVRIYECKNAVTGVTDRCAELGHGKLRIGNSSNHLLTYRYTIITRASFSSAIGGNCQRIKLTENGTCVHISGEQKSKIDLENLRPDLSYHVLNNTPTQSVSHWIPVGHFRIILTTFGDFR